MYDKYSEKLLGVSNSEVESVQQTKIAFECADCYNDSPNSMMTHPHANVNVGTTESRSCLRQMNGKPAQRHVQCISMYVCVCLCVITRVTNGVGPHQRRLAAHASATPTNINGRVRHEQFIKWSPNATCNSR